MSRAALTLQCKWGPAERKTRVATITDDNDVSGRNHGQFFVSLISDVNGIRHRERSAEMWRRLTHVHVLLHVLANGHSPVSLAVALVRWRRGQGGHESTDSYREWSTVSVGGKPGPSTCARTRTRAEVNVRPRPLVNTDRHKDSG